MNFFRKRKYKHLTDSDLLILFYQDPSDLIIEIWIERYIHLVLGVCIKYLKQREDAEDVTMSIFSNLSQKLQKNKVENFKPWLHQVTKNECFQLLRKKKPEFSELSDYKHPFYSDDTSNEEKENQLYLMEEALNELKPEQKICIQKFYLEDKSYQEISDELNLPINKVKSYIQNGKRNLKLYLEEYDAFKQTT